MPLAIQNIDTLPAPMPTLPEIHRVSVVDIAELGVWLIGRLKEKYPHQTDQALLSWLRASTTDNECWFGRVKGGIGMFTIHRRFLMKPWVEEAFCLAVTQADVDYAAMLYRPVREWAVGQGCDHIVVDQLSDCPKQMIHEEIGQSNRVAATWVWLVPPPPK